MRPYVSKQRFPLRLGGELRTLSGLVHGNSVSVYRPCSSLKSLGALLEPLQTAIDFYVRIHINQPINDL